MKLYHSHASVFVPTADLTKLKNITRADLTRASSVEDACVAFIKSPTIQGKLKEGSHRAAEPYLALIKHFGAKSIQEFSDRAFASDWREDMFEKLADGTINGIKSKCAKVCAWLMEKKLVDENGWAEIKNASKGATTKSRQTFAMTQEDQKKLLDYLDNIKVRKLGKKGAYGDMTRVALLTSMRYIEVLTLTPENVDLKKGEVRIQKEVSKTKKERTVFLTDQAVEILEKYKETADVFGRFFPFSYGALQERIAEYNEKMKEIHGEEWKDVHFHLTRHTAITDAATVAESIEELRSFSGHASMESLKSYLHINAEAGQRMKRKMQERRV